MEVEGGGGVGGGATVVVEGGGGVGGGREGVINYGQ